MINQCFEDIFKAKAILNGISEKTNKEITRYFERLYHRTIMTINGKEYMCYGVNCNRINFYDELPEVTVSLLFVTTDKLKGADYRKAKKVRDQYEQDGYISEEETDLYRVYEWTMSFKTALAMDSKLSLNKCTIPTKS